MDLSRQRQTEAWRDAGAPDQSNAGQVRNLMHEFLFGNAFDMPGGRRAHMGAIGRFFHPQRRYNHTVDPSQYPGQTPLERYGDIPPPGVDPSSWGQGPGGSASRARWEQIEAEMNAAGADPSQVTITDEPQLRGRTRNILRTIGR